MTSQAKGNIFSPIEGNYGEQITLNLGGGGGGGGGNGQ